MRAESSPSFESRLLLTVGLILWLIATVASIWEVLSLQPPDSPMHAGVLSGPIAQLASITFALGTGCLVVSLLFPILYAAGGGRVAALCLSASAALHTSALFYAASHGLLAIQILDPRADARLALYVRATAHALMSISLGLLLARALRQPRRS